MLINGRYLLDKRIGSGGMGEVYLAQDRLNGDQVALKRVFFKTDWDFEEVDVVSLAPQNTESRLRLSLAKEFQILAGIRHPYIISVLDYGFDEEKNPFYTMTYLPTSTTLLDAASGESAERKITLIEQLLQALNYLHRRGVLHLDLKPENVLVHRGEVRVLDFGLSSRKEEEVKMGGTPLYMAPEMIKGKAPSEVSDLYAVGVLLYQLFADDHPFGSFDTEFYNRLLNFEPNLERIPGPIQPIIQKLLVKEPAHRFQKADQVLTALAEKLSRPRLIETLAIRESYLQAARFVGREMEMEQLTQALQNAGDGIGSSWLIGGESGVGKSRLLQEIETIALVQGFMVLRGQESENKSGDPLQLWHQPLRLLIATYPEISDSNAAVLRQLVPDIDQLLGREVPAATTLEGKAAQLRLFTTIARLLRQSERPILLILEDIHLSEAGLLPLPFVSQLIQEQKLLILASYRSDERPSMPQEMPQANHLHLSRLSPEALRQLSIAMLGQAGESEAIQSLLQRETEGNAFFAVEVVRALAEDAGRLSDITHNRLPEQILPNGIQDIVQKRVDKIPQSAITLLHKAALAGREIDVNLIKSLDTEIDVENWWLPLCADAGVIEIKDGMWQFSHGKIRDGLLVKVDRDSVMACHREIAERVEVIYPHQPGQAARLAYHWGEAGDRKKELEAAIVAGRYAAAQFANQDAIRWISRAIALTQENNFERRFKLVKTREYLLKLTGGNFRREADLEQLLEIAILSRNSKYQAISYLRLSEYDLSIGNVADAHDHVEKSIALAAQLPDGVRLNMEANTHRALIHLRAAAYEEAEKEFKEILQVYQKIEDLTGIAHCYRYLGSIAWYRGNFQNAFDYFELGLRSAQMANDQIEESNLLNNLGATADNLGKYDEAQRYYEESLTLYRKIGLREGEAKVLHNLGTVMDNQGYYAQAQRYYEESLDISLIVDRRWGVGLTKNYLGRNAWYVGEYERAETFYQEALAILTPLSDKLEMAGALDNLGMLAGHKGAYTQALDYYAKSLAIRREIGNRFGEARTLLNLGFLYLSMEQIEASESNFSDARRHFEEMNQPHAAIEPEVGLLQIALNRGKSIDVERLTSVLQHIEAEPELKGTVYPFRIYLNVYKMLKNVNSDGALQLLGQAYHLLQVRVALIKDSEKQRSYLTSIPEHFEIIEVYQELNRSNAIDGKLGRFVVPSLD